MRAALGRFTDQADEGLREVGDGLIAQEKERDAQRPPTKRLQKKATPSLLGCLSRRLIRRTPGGLLGSGARRIGPGNERLDSTCGRRATHLFDTLEAERTEVVIENHGKPVALGPSHALSARELSVSVPPTESRHNPNAVIGTHRFEGHRIRVECG